MFFTYTLFTFLLDYGKLNLLKAHEVFFIRLATTTAVKNQKKKTQHNEKHNDTKQHKKLKKANYKTTIYQDRYVLHPDTDSFGG